MVSYYSLSTMYHGQQTSWYPSTYRHHQPQQQFLSCMHEMGADQQWMGAHSHNHPHNHTHPHTHAVFSPQEWPVQEDHILPSPPITELSSPGPGVTPPTQQTPQPFVRPPSARSPYEWMKKPTSPQVRPSPVRSPYEWMKKPSYQTQPNPGGDEIGKTRTKDKYRVVYTDHQRLELEKEFHYSRYITIRRKAELAASLGLSERQVKIWFQNRRAKERKQMKKREELIHKEKMQQLALL